MPALYQLKLLTTPLQDFWQITMLTAIGAYFGLFFATPLREFFVIHAARDLQLIFPSSFATATTIRSMHMAFGGAKLARQKMKSLSVAFCWAMLSRLVSQFAIGILWVRDMACIVIEQLLIADRTGIRLPGSIC